MNMENFFQMIETLLEKTKDKFIEFLETRKKGAAKIERTARAKGGASLLTAQHFKAKEKPYKKAIEAALSENREEFYKKEADKCYSKLSSWRNMTQKEFQTVMGELEVWGEVYLKSKNK